MFWDEYLKEKKVFLILLGSSIGMMETEVLGKKSPLYGRRSGQIKLLPFKFREVLKFYPQASIEKVIEFYAAVGDIPLYLLEFDRAKNVLENIKVNAHSVLSELKKEKVFLFDLKDMERVF